MNQQKTRHQDFQLLLFMLMSCLFLSFFVYQLTVTFTLTIDQWDITHYVWIGFLGIFIILCILKYKSVYAEVMAEQKELDLVQKVLTFKKTDLEQQLLN
ncbi:MAG TPA: hypothetical protein DCY20_01310, partial [Firmicutes bacterium]|nr:hypothetical protein [Bacillota bacterium]